MTQQKLSDQKMPPNPAIAELQAIRKEVAMLRRDLNSQKTLPPIDESISLKEKRVPVGAAIFKVVLGLAALLSFLGLSRDTGKKVQDRLETPSLQRLQLLPHQAVSLKLLSSTGLDYFWTKR